MPDNDLLALGIGASRPSRDRHPSQAFKERAAQSVAQDAEYRKLIGKKSRAGNKENRPATPQARLTQNRNQITSVAVRLPQPGSTVSKPRAPILPSATGRSTALSTPRPTQDRQGQQQASPPDREDAARQTPQQETEDTGADVEEPAADPTSIQPLERRPRGAGRKPRPRGGDLSARERHFVERAYPAMRALVAKDPFNIKEENEKKVSNAIIRARHSLPDDKDLVVTDGMRQLIYARMAQMYGDVKRIGSDKVSAHYGLVTSSKDKITQRNVRKVANLLDRDGFVYKDTKERVGMYQHPCISDMINTLWFSSRNKEGPLFPHIFNGNGDGIAPETLALVLTGIYSCILQWETGTFVMVEFRESRFRGDYTDILKGLREYKKNSPSNFRKICCNLYKAGIAHAGVVIKARTRSGLTAEDFQRAALMDTFDSDDSSEDEEEENATNMVLPRSSDGHLRGASPNGVLMAEGRNSEGAENNPSRLFRKAQASRKDARKDSTANDGWPEVREWQDDIDADEDNQDADEDIADRNGAQHASKRPLDDNDEDDDSGPRRSKRHKPQDGFLDENDVIDISDEEKLQSFLSALSPDDRKAWATMSEEERLEFIMDVQASMQEQAGQTGLYDDE